MLTGTFRADGSSRFTNDKWGYFPSVAVAWTASNESFMESTRDLISNLKIRASYGVIGNQDIDPYSTLAILNTTTTYFGNSSGVTGYWANTLATPDIKWEKTKQFDVGFDIALTANIVQSKDWSWSTTLNGTYLKNKVTKLTAQEPIIYGGSFQSIITDCTIIKEGEAIGTFFGYRWAGIDNEGYDTFYTANDEITRNPSTDDRVVLGKASPDFTLGWNAAL